MSIGKSEEGREKGEIETPRRWVKGILDDGIERERAKQPPFPTLLPQISQKRPGAYARSGEKEAGNGTGLYVIT